jgi:hypothetical protein
MPKNEKTVDRLLLISVNVLLAGMVGLIGVGGKDIKTSLKDTNELITQERINSAIHTEKIRDGEKKDILQDTEILIVKEDVNLNRFEIKEAKEKIHVLEDITNN